MISDRLKELRLRSGLKQDDLLKKFNISSARYSQYETGKRMPDYSLLIDIARFYGTSVDYLLTGEIINKDKKGYGKMDIKRLTEDIDRSIKIFEENYRKKLDDYENKIDEDVWRVLYDLGAYTKNAFDAMHISLTKCLDKENKNEYEKLNQAINSIDDMKAIQAEMFNLLKEQSAQNFSEKKKPGTGTEN